MVLRNILRYFMASRHSEQLVQQLSELPLVRRAAQLTALVILRLAQNIKDPQARIASFSSRLRNNLKEEVNRAKKELTGKKS